MPAVPHNFYPISRKPITFACSSFAYSSLSSPLFSHARPRKQKQLYQLFSLPCSSKLWRTVNLGFSAVFTNNDQLALRSAVCIYKQEGQASCVYQSGCLYGVASSFLPSGGVRGNQLLPCKDDDGRSMQD